MPRTAAPKPMVDIIGVINNYSASINTEKLATSQTELVAPLSTYKQKLGEIRSIFAGCSVNGSTWDKQIDQLLQQQHGQQKYAELQKKLGTLLLPPDATTPASDNFAKAMEDIAVKTATTTNARVLTLGDTYLPARNELLKALDRGNEGTAQNMRDFLDKGSNHEASKSVHETLKEVFSLGDEQATALMKEMLPAIESAQRNAANELKRKTQEDATPFFQKITREMVRLSLLASLSEIEANKNNPVFNKLPDEEQDVAVATHFNTARFRDTKIADLERFQTRDFSFLSLFWSPHEIKFDKETGTLRMGIPQATFLENPDDRLHDVQTFVKTLFAHAQNPHETGLRFSVNMADIERNPHPQQEKPGQKSAETLVRAMVKQALELGMPMEKLHFTINGTDVKPQQLRTIVGEELVGKSQESYKTMIQQYKTMTAEHSVTKEPQTQVPGSAA